MDLSLSHPLLKPHRDPAGALVVREVQAYSCHPSRCSWCVTLSHNNNRQKLTFFSSRRLVQEYEIQGTLLYLHRSLADRPSNSSPSSGTTSSSTTTSYTPPTNTKPLKLSRVSQHAFSQTKSSTPLTKLRSTVDHHTKVTLATHTRNAWSMSRISALYSPFSSVDGVHTIHSAYKEEFGCNFTSAIPTNVFGPYDNLYVKRLSYYPFRRLNRF